MKRLAQYLFILILLTSVCFAQDVSLTAEAGKKTALVVGVSKYTYAPPLKNPNNDASDISRVLKELGFNVVTLIDPNIKELTDAIDAFGDNLLKSDVGLFYYSGHGAEYGGENFLFPISAHPIKAPGDLMYEGYALNRLLSRFDNSNVKTSIIILDACRDNPLARISFKGLSAKQGLAVVELPSGSFIGYAASPGKVASDGKRRNGTYTEAILKFIPENGQTIDQIFNKVNKEVRIQTAGSQIPFKSSSLDNDFYFSEIYPDTRTIAVTADSYPILKINAKRFPMPTIVKGYSESPISNYVRASINKDTFSQREFIELKIESLNEISWDKATPLFVSIVKKSSRNTEDGGIYQLQNEYQPTGIKHSIKLLADYPPGFYQVRIGFYIISELNAEYPQFTTKAFDVTITK